MAGLEISTPASAQIFTTFHHKLQNEWKLKAYCGRDYYRADDIVKWMRRTDTNEPTINAGLLLTEAYKRNSSYIYHLNSADISFGENRCLIVFAILLELGCGHLIHVFQRHKFVDERLPELPDAESLLRELSRGRIGNVNEFWTSFQEKMWLYYPCRLKFRMSNTFLDPGRGRWIMPFCKRQPVNMKGGTAQVWEVVVPEPLVPHSLAEVVGEPYNDNDHGMCYTFALKSFTQENYDIFDFERAAYLAMQNKPGIVRFLGEYEIDERQDGTVTSTYNILLEYGDEDLEEFFASSENYPPNLNEETIHFWMSLANVAEALDTMHDLEVKRENGHRDSFTGCHCDLKPDNILRVNSEFKLADFGFAKFQRRNPGRFPDKQFITGGTETYGAPECDIARRDPSKAVSQAIDTWSFGCVLSVSATWVVLGYQGVLAYHGLRRTAIEKLKERQQRGENVSLPVADDAFHDGINVLPEVIEWHVHLRGLLRVSDTITGQILDLVDQHMLVTESARQSNPEALHIAIQNRVKQAQVGYNTLLEEGVLKPMTNSVKEALLKIEKDNIQNDSQGLETAHNTTNESSSFSDSSSLASPQRPHVKSSRINKPKRIEKIIPGKVAHRQDVFTMHERPLSDTRARADQSNYMIRDRRIESNYSRMTPSIPTIQELQSTESPKPHKFTPTPSLPPPTEKEAVTSIPSITTSMYPPHEVSIYSGYGNSTESQMHEGYGYTSTERYSPIRTGMHDVLHAHIPVVPEMSRTLPIPLGQFYLDPSWPISQEHQAQKNKDRGVMARIRRKDHDRYLENFLIHRDIMFLVDNDTSMAPYWDAMSIVLEVLVPKVELLDKTGLDLEFTIGSEYKAHGVSGNKLLSKFKGAKQKTQSQSFRFETNMTQTLNRIFDNYLNNPERAMTLIILTNGNWEGTRNDTSVEKTIADFLKKPALSERMEKRWFTIQFISFGHEVPQILKDLDDNIEKKYSVPDVIDTEHVSGNVYKMILGSFVAQFDIEPPSPISPASLSTPSQLDIIDSPTSSVYVSSPMTRQNSSRSSSGLRSIFRGRRSSDIAG
ncbi:hypothetical protein F4677DRAFT_457997 [Hypoxylon crocopeplum]|nr:hypothetical protein F4677DRAFT_457997 [Hypoxylon crocopeplum]